MSGGEGGGLCFSCGESWGSRSGDEFVGVALFGVQRWAKQGKVEGGLHIAAFRYN